MTTTIECKPADVNLKAMLNSPARFTPAVPIPDWSKPALVVQAPPRPPATTLNVAAPNTITDPHSSLTIQNCVATIDLGCELNLRTIAFRTRNSEYNPSRFHGLIMRIREPRTTALIFRSGKVVCTGARSEQHALLASKKFARLIQKLGFNVRFVSFTISNIVATCDLRFPIKLENLNHMHGQFSRYEPELFPGLIYRMIKPQLAVLVFVNGKLVLTGAKSRKDITDALDNIYPVLRSFRKN